MTITSIPPELPPRGTRIGSLLLLPVALLISACDAGRKGDLETGVPVEREIGGGEVHSYRLPLEDETYLRLRIDQPGVDVTAKIRASDGTESSFFDEPKRFDEPDRLAWIAKRGGDYQLFVQPRDARSPRGKYRIKLQELRPATPRDSERLAAEAEYEEGRRLLKADSEESRIRSRGLQQRALKRWEAVGDRIGQVDALNQIAEIHNGLGDSDAAIPAATRALQLAREERYREGEARAIVSLGDAFNRMNEPEEALARFKESLPLWKDLGDSSRQGITLYSMGQACRNASRPEEALRYLAQAQSLLHQAGDFGNEAFALTAQGWLQANRGEFGQALESAETALKVSRAAKAPAAEAAALQLLGLVHKQRGEFEAALQHFKEGLARTVSLGDKTLEVLMRQSLGSVYYNLGEPDRTLTEYARALEISTEPSRGRLLANTGFIHQQAKKDPQTALWYYRQALALYEDDSDPSGMALAFTYTGTAYTLLGRPQEGLPFLLKALEVRRQIGERAREANTLLEIGSAYKVLGDPRRGEDYYRQALDLAEAMGNTDLKAECLYRWAVLDRSQGKPKEALEKVRESLAVVESERDQVVSDKSRTSFLASKRAHYELLVELLADLDDRYPGQYRAAALEASEWARARSLRDLLAEGRVQAGIPLDLQKRDVELRSRLSWIQDQLGKKSSAELEAQMDEVQDALEQLRVEIRKRYQHYAEIRYPTPLRSRQIQDLLDERLVLLHYFVGERASFLLVVTRQGLEIHRLPGSSQLAAQVAQLRRLLQERGRRYLPTYQRAAAAMYDVLLRPAASALEGKSRLLIAPDGPLYLLPFEALLTEDRRGSYAELPYLLRRYAVSYIPSASVLADLRRSKPIRKPGKSFIAFADPDYGGNGRALARGAAVPTGSSGFTRLPESRQEVQRIAKLYPQDSMLFLGRSATEEEVKKNPFLATAPLVHFALHGTVNEVRPELSALELTRLPRSSEDGMLQVFEIFNLKLHADLLTLSACETALGKEVRGEGMLGLTRAFFFAGARSIVVSLWPVADRSTPDLMYDVYQNLGSGKSEALRRAKLAMIGSGEYSAPYYWAPFVLSGDLR